MGFRGTPDCAPDRGTDSAVLVEDAELSSLGGDAEPTGLVPGTNVSELVLGTSSSCVEPSSVPERETGVSFALGVELLVSCWGRDLCVSAWAVRLTMVGWDADLSIPAQVGEPFALGSDLNLSVPALGAESFVPGTDVNPPGPDMPPSSLNPTAPGRDTNLSSPALEAESSAPGPCVNLSVSPPLDSEPFASDRDVFGSSRVPRGARLSFMLCRALHRPRLGPPCHDS
ncbi:hypothetical protein Ssi02_75500 [Sinosporangium siamense]|uniref:Uncharacterized protein n=1 Tax=Sinosporangium siamense TaxID=1367973 RepID=A0A919RRC5_9ACTN|nr:hypothetical protein Ssi02_75500 [Sinosporangium siamense]